MPQSAQADVNAFECSWLDGSCTFAVPGGDTIDDFDWTAFKCERTVSRGERKRLGLTVKTTVGSLAQSASITISRTSHRKLMEALAKHAREIGGVKRLSTVLFTILVQWTPIGDTQIYQRKFYACSMGKDSDDASDGDDPHNIEIDLQPRRIVDILDDGSEVTL